MISTAKRELTVGEYFALPCQLRSAFIRERTLFCEGELILATVRVSGKLRRYLRDNQIKNSDTLTHSLLSHLIFERKITLEEILAKIECLDERLTLRLDVIENKINKESEEIKKIRKTLKQTTDTRGMNLKARYIPD